MVGNRAWLGIATPLISSPCVCRTGGISRVCLAGERSSDVESAEAADSTRRQYETAIVLLSRSDGVRRNALLFDNRPTATGGEAGCARRPSGGTAACSAAGGRWP